MERRHEPREGRGGSSRKRITITECEVTPIDAHGFGVGIKGLATITLNNALVLRSLRIIKDREGNLVVAYPAQMGRDKTWYDVVEPKSDTLREEIARRVLAEYHRVVEELEAAVGAPSEPEPPEPTEAGPEAAPAPPELAEVNPEPPESLPEEPTLSSL